MSASPHSVIHALLETEAAESCTPNVQVCSRLPAVALEWRDLRPAIAPNGDAQAEEAEGEGATFKVGITMRRLRGPRSRALPRVYAPRFPKVFLSPSPVCLVTQRTTISCYPG